jgi:hypothetical protein
LNSDEDEIISIQFQKILLHNGKPDSPLTILTSWTEGSSEFDILNQIVPLITSPNPWTFVPVGNNLNFEFKFLLSKIARYFDFKIDPLFFHSRPHIDLKHVMILLNRGRFKGYNLFLRKIERGENIPTWYQNKEYLKIIKYIEMEAEAFTNFYSNISVVIFNHELRQLILNKELQKNNVN